MSGDLSARQAQQLVYETDTPVCYDTDGPVAWITMNRPQYNNAQNSQMTYALDAAFAQATDDDAIRVIVLAGEGKHFSAGHDIGTPGRDHLVPFERKLMFGDHTTRTAMDAIFHMHHFAHAQNDLVSDNSLGALDGAAMARANKQQAGEG